MDGISTPGILYQGVLQKYMMFLDLLMLSQTYEIRFPYSARSVLPVFPNQSVFIFPHLTWEVLPGFCRDVTDAMITLITMIMTTKLI